MTAAEQEPGDAPRAPEVIRPGLDTKAPRNVANDAQGKKEKPPSATVARMKPVWIATSQSSRETSSGSRRKSTGFASRKSAT